MKLTIREAKDLVHPCMTQMGFTTAEAKINTVGLIDGDGRGLSHGATLNGHDREPANQASKGIVHVGV